jgi:glycosyltransferase involved in cell wall biosynthesis
LLLRVFRPKTKVICDPRGFYPEEAIVHGRWRISSASFKLWKVLERKLFNSSDAVIGLSPNFVERIETLAPRARGKLVYASVDVDTFRRIDAVREEQRQKLGLENKMVFVYCGGLGFWHDPSMLARVFHVLRNRFDNAVLLVITQFNREALEEIFTAEALDGKDYVIYRAKSTEVPAYLAAADFGIVPLRHVEGDGAITVVADTMVGLKVAEFLSAGLPFVVNHHIVGIRKLMESNHIGAFFDPKNLAALPAEISGIQEQYNTFVSGCREVAEREFSIRGAATQYRDIYRQTIGSAVLTVEPNRRELASEAVEKAGRH